MKILVTPTSFQPGSENPALEALRAAYPELVFNPCKRPLTEDELLPLLQDCDSYIAGLDFVTEKVLRACKKLKVISRYGVGYDRVDVAAAKALGIAVTNTPGVNSEAVAELTMGLILSLVRRIPYLDRQTKSSQWLRSTGTELAGKTLGIVGLGAIGKLVARCAKGFDMNVIAYDPYIQEGYCAAHGIGIRTLDALLCEANVITLHLPLNNQTHHIIGQAAIAQMQPGTILVNASRGALIDEDAAYDALCSGQLGGLGLDAFEREPPTGSKLLTLDSVVATPHTGAHTAEATAKMAATSVENLIAVLEGRPCHSRIC